jgi:hypothetical protein
LEFKIFILNIIAGDDIPHLRRDRCAYGPAESLALGKWHRLLGCCEMLDPSCCWLLLGGASFSASFDHVLQDLPSQPQTTTL